MAGYREYVETTLTSCWFNSHSDIMYYIGRSVEGNVDKPY